MDQLLLRIWSDYLRPPGGVQRADERQQGEAVELEPGGGGGEEKGLQLARQRCSPRQRDSQPPSSYTGHFTEKARGSMTKYRMPK